MKTDRSTVRRHFKLEQRFHNIRSAWITKTLSWIVKLPNKTFFTKKHVHLSCRNNLFVRAYLVQMFLIAAVYTEESRCYRNKKTVDKTGRQKIPRNKINKKTQLTSLTFEHKCKRASFSNRICSDCPWAPGKRAVDCCLRWWYSKEMRLRSSLERRAFQVFFVESLS